MEKSSVDILWLVSCSGMVFLMQAGFLCLETGLTRSKNNINVASKNITDLGISAIAYWMIGYGLMFGASKFGLIGSTHFLPNVDERDSWFSAFLLFQFMYCGAAVTILSGAVAERIRFTSYIGITIIVSVVIYPIFGHWVWNGIDGEILGGWLAERGFVDFAGSTVIHSLGGWVGLAALLVIGPRAGRFSSDGTVNKIPAANIPSAVLGVMLLWFGWFGFTGGSTLTVNEYIPKILFNTLIGGAAGLTMTIILHLILKKHFDIILIMNGALAGLVAITAACNAVSTVEALIIGTVGAAVMYGVHNLLLRFKIDDAVSAIPVHLGAGIWGTLAVGLFGDPKLLGTGLGQMEQIIAQISGICACFVWSFSIAFIFLKTLNKIYPIRVSLKDEATGLNITEHGERSELIELFTVMKEQEKTGNLSLRVPVEPFTEVGQIGSLYNQVMGALEHAVAKTEAIVQSAMDGIVTFSKNDLLISTLNPCAEAAFGCQLADVKGKPITELVCFDFESSRDASTGEIKTILERAAAEKLCRELAGKKADGCSFPMEASFAEATVDDDVFYTGTFRDITNHKQNLESLKDAKKAADAASLAKSEFLANMSHEHRTPLNGILGYAQILTADERLTGDQLKAAKIIESSGRHLLDLINEVLDLSKIEAGEFNLDLNVFELPEFLGEFRAMFQLRSEQKGLAFILQPDDALPKHLYADEKKLRQILLNLIGNAIKFTDNGSITFCVEILKDIPPDHTQTVLSLPSDQWQSNYVRLRFSVTDTGVGIATDNLERIFVEFQRVGDLRDSISGTGLGLAISKKLVELMGGNLRVESTPPSGTTFWFDIDMIAVTATGVGDMKINDNRQIKKICGQNHRILIAADNKENGILLTNMLKPSGFLIQEITLDSNAVEGSISNKPDLLIVDLVAPDPDGGYQDIERIRKFSTLSGVPIILISGSVAQEYQGTSMKGGCQGFLSDPVDRRQLLKLVSDELGLDVIFDNNTSETPTSDSTGSTDSFAWVLPPQENTDAIIRYSQRGDIKGLLKTLDDIDRLDSKYNALVIKLRELAEQFDDAQILSIINKLRNNG